MAKVEFLLPDVGEGLEEGEIVSWLVAPGDTVSRDQPLVEVQTDKALVELPSPVAGQIVSLAFGPGDIVKVGQVLVVLEDGRGGDTAPPSVLASATPTGTAPAPVPGTGRPKAAPAVRKLALERGVDLATLTGTGPGGRILATDVETAARPPATDVPAPIEVEEAGRLGWLEAGRHPLRGIRRVTAETMARSWSEIPHLTTLDEIDAAGLLAARRRLADAGIDATIGALLVAAVARGLRRYPVFNASLELSAGEGGGTIVVHPDCNIGLAVATAEGLVVPVIRQADRRSLSDLAAEVRRLTAAARNRRVEMAELRGGTFTISNWGAIGGRFATPLIRPPEVGIMGFGAIRPRPFVVDGEVKARPTLPWSLSADHRLIDGDVSTAFSEYVTGLLTDPVALLAELLATGTAGGGPGA
ncbi:MAG TPA: dihydrolipoamide acetyltransferase family protein [Acidimicrobiia bacterium]|nr:dihydrolipoamide acetyltransferase family protein [Acidimicrobiia bacterium]